MYPDPEPDPNKDPTLVPDSDDPLADAIDDFIRKRMHARMAKNKPFIDYVDYIAPEEEGKALPCPENIQKNGGWPGR
jgi:hypothetical protein